MGPGFKSRGWLEGRFVGNFVCLFEFMDNTNVVIRLLIVVSLLLGQ